MTPSEALLRRPGTLFYRHDGTLLGPILIAEEIRVGAASFPLTEAGLHTAIELAPQVDVRGARRKQLLAFPECGRIAGLPGVFVSDPFFHFIAKLTLPAPIAHAPPQPQAAMDPRTILCLTLEDRIVALFEPRGMTWNGAVEALIRDGLVALTPEQEDLLSTETHLWTHPAWFRRRPATPAEVTQWTSDGKPILQAQRAKPGQGKTSPVRSKLIQALAAELGYSTVDVPERSLDARKLESDLLAEKRRKREEGTLPPTAKQVALAEDLAIRCNIVVPDPARKSSRECSAFIKDCLDVAPPSERQLKYARYLSGGVPLPESAFRSARACGDWITEMESKARR